MRCLSLALILLAACSGEIERPRKILVQKEQDPPPPPPAPFIPAPVSARVLLSWQYRNAIESLLGAEAAAAVSPPPDAPRGGFDAIGAAQRALPTSAIEAYERSAWAAARAANAGELLSCDTTRDPVPGVDADRECLEPLVRTFGRKALRRALAPVEVDAWTKLGVGIAAQRGLTHAAEAIIAGLLQSPDFLYLVEVGEPDPAQPTRARLTSLELAARLAFFLTGYPPDEGLMAAAESGGLASAEAVRLQARRLLSSQQARASLEQFFDERYGLRAVPSLQKSPLAFPEFTPSLAAAMREESLAVLAAASWEGDFRQVFTTRQTFVSAELFAFYALSGSPPKDQPQQVTLPPGPRAGLLGHASILAALSHPLDTSPTRRGRFVRERLLCELMSDPPPGANLELPVDPPNQPRTMREKLELHRQSNSCIGCHRLTDGIGFGLENFDAAGRLRVRESNGLAIDAQSELDGSRFAGAAELGRLLETDPRVTRCLTRSLFRAATGHLDTPGERPSLDQVHAAFAGSGYQLTEALIALVASDAFRFAAPTVVPEESP